jgi:TonB family protein
MMTAGPVSGEISQPVPVPRLLVELPSWPEAFFRNLRDLVLPPRLPRLELQSAPAPFWPDVFVKRGIPWRRMLDSSICHALACALIVGVSRLIAMQPQATLRPTFDHSQVIYYQASEYLPPLDTRSTPRSAKPQKADPEFSRQPIISVPVESDNRLQTIVAPPDVKLKRDVALPNIVAWSDTMEKPRLEIPPAPLTLAAEINRITPRMERSVVAPPPDAELLKNRREGTALQGSVVAPPPDVRSLNAAVFEGPQPTVIAPPPNVESASPRPIGELNIGRSVVIAPAPQLAVGEQRTISGRRSAIKAAASQVVAPPPSISLGSSGASFGSRGRVIALNLHPAGAPAGPPAGNRRGTFAAAPEGHAGASGSAGATAEAGPDGNGNGSSKETGSGPNRTSSDLPSGLYVGNAGVKTSPVAGTKTATTETVNPNLTANVRPPRVSGAPSQSTQPSSSGKLSEAEREVFGDRKFYSLTLNMPNLNSAGGSWVIRFAELNRGSNGRDAKLSSNSAVGDLSQPAATRKVDPAYPLQLMRENVAGTVILYAVIHADGTVGSVRVLRGVDARLDQFASAAVSQWKFQPATKNGTPVDVEATFQIPFRPQRVGTNF